MSDTFNIGDKVCVREIKSPHMAVLKIANTEGINTLVETCWFDTTARLQRAEFPLRMLKRVDAEKK